MARQLDVHYTMSSVLSLCGKPTLVTYSLRDTDCPDCLETIGYEDRAALLRLAQTVLEGEDSPRGSEVLLDSYLTLNEIRQKCGVCPL